MVCCEELWDKGWYHCVLVYFPLFICLWSVLWWLCEWILPPIFVLCRMHKCLFLSLITFTAGSCWMCCAALEDAAQWTPGKTREVKSRKSILLIKSEDPPPSAQLDYARACFPTQKEVTQSYCCPEDLLKHVEQIHRIQIKRWQFTFFFIQLLYSTNIRTITLLGAHCL